MEVTLEHTENMAKYITDLWKDGKFASPQDLVYAAELCAEHLKFFVPKSDGGGDLEDAYNVGISKDEFYVTWAGKNMLPYTRYQYYGKVMGPNFAVFDDAGQQVQGAWYSPKGKKKVITTKPLGVERDVKISRGRVVHIDGYTKQWARPFWIDEAMKEPRVYYPLRHAVGRYLYEAWCDKAGVPIVGRREF